jgi:hypothetical protein
MDLNQVKSCVPSKSGATDHLVEPTTNLIPREVVNQCGQPSFLGFETLRLPISRWQKFRWRNCELNASFTALRPNLTCDDCQTEYISLFFENDRSRIRGSWRTHCDVTHDANSDLRPRSFAMEFQESEVWPTGRREACIDRGKDNPTRKSDPPIGQCSKDGLCCVFLLQFTPIQNLAFAWNPKMLP